MCLVGHQIINRLTDCVIFVFLIPHHVTNLYTMYQRTPGTTHNTYQTTIRTRTDNDIRCSQLLDTVNEYSSVSESNV